MTAAVLLATFWVLVAAGTAAWLVSMIALVGLAVRAVRRDRQVPGGAS